MSADAGDAGTAPGTAPATGEAGGTGEGTEQLQEGQPGTGDQQQEGEDLATQLAHWKEQARKNERRAKDNAAAAARLKTIEQQNMTEVEKAQADLRDAQRERDEALSGHARMMAAAANNLPVELIDLLGTGTDEEINERAELLASSIEETAAAIAEELLKEKIASGELIVASNGNGRNGQPQVVPGRPVESLRAGSAPAGTAPATQEQWFRQLLHGGQ
jgi:hypothetical protein